jgi:hypothetical protein
LPFVFTGCSGEISPKLVPVSGRVTLRDKPLPGMLVLFLPEQASGLKGKEARGTTNQNGDFTLETYPYGPGAMPGRYKVTIQFYSRNDGLPRKYTKLSLTPLQVEVKEGGNQFNFPLEP